ncbi:MAG: MotA/TolQ/ExbB proton channel family protein, partial [Marinobacter sp.]
MEAELSVWHLIASAGILVQLVMLLLVLASIISWALIIQRIQVFRKARQAQLDFENRFWSGMDLGQLYKEVNDNPTPYSGLESVFRAGFKEFSRLRQQSRDADAVMEGAQRAMRVAFSREQERLEMHLPFLATVGSTSP